MLKVPFGQDPYDVIGEYIKNHITVIEDIIVVIEIDDKIMKTLFTAENGDLFWNNDWYEGEKNIILINFFPVSEATKLIRCKNCCFWDEIWDPAVSFDNTDYHYCNILDRPTYSDFFCAEGLEINNQEYELEVFNKNDLV